MKHTQGFSLVELMVALTIGLVSVGAVSAVLISSSGIYRASENRARMQENARFAVNQIQDDVRMAGFMGCFNIDMFPTRFKNLAKNPTDFQNDYATWIGGHEAGVASWSPTLNPAIGSGGHTPTPGNDVLVVRLPGGQGVPLNDEMTTTSVPIPVASNSSFTEGGLALVADCSHANLFVVGNKAAGNKLVHAANVNTSAKTSKAFSNLEGAVVTPVTTVSYFLSNSSDGVSGNKSLWRQTGLNPAEEIADGIERMQIEYGIDTDAVPDGVTNQFVTADAVGSGRVTALKVSLLVKSLSNKVAQKTQTFNFDGYVGQSGADKRLYAPFSTTIALRNRVN